MKLPTLYKECQRWDCRVVNLGYYSEIIVEFGQVGGKIQEKITKIYAGKNIGKSNETTHYEQACKEARSKWNKQKDKLYVEDGEECATATTLRPMLAQSYDKHSHKIKFPAYIQKKIDGCVSGDTLIKTKEYGYKPIKYIVENKLCCKVLSYNINTEKYEYQPVLYYFYNKDTVEETQWFEIELESGEKITITGNHPVYLPEIRCYRRVDELIGDENMMLI